MTCYRECLLHGLPGGWGVSHGTLGAISGEVARGYSWHGTYMIVNSGLSVTGADGSDAGADHFGNNWAYIRHCWTVYENIDMVPDMTPEEKGYVKAEALALRLFSLCSIRIMASGSSPFCRAASARVFRLGL